MADILGGQVLADARYEGQQPLDRWPQSHFSHGSPRVLQLADGARHERRSNACARALRQGNVDFARSQSLELTENA